ncbi:MaoC family dehydratase N-terminal domain-containing protein [Microbacterium sp. p3-SID336]|uniref:MaoC family dehydratase N-terminal domain-containing protein n=1 Tax=Microbacterium sp. p3-SID336 TaxID=2916212 RepID=UPI0021A7BD00|nr:MaoC family dehydratase N-terminal domain-containing protein [Microbacterium sp. p3-SID336]MCT1479916.1 MaoC family dehydratase N-terminal domain-containing protein [Microbacterium sp. p3-SID336]
MVIDRERALTLPFPELTFTVERGRLRAFARAIGEDDPIYVDVTAARAVGHPDLPVPPTFAFSMGLEQPNPFWYLETLGIDLLRILHGEQRFHYQALAYAGDELRLSTHIADCYSKREGALDFLEIVTEVTREADPIVTATSLLVVQNPEDAR